MEKQEGPQWLPSTALMALRLLREQDPVTLWEENTFAFASLANFVRNWSSKFAPKIELIKKDGLRWAKRRWCEQKYGNWNKAVSPVFGQWEGQRGVVLLDPPLRQNRFVNVASEDLMKDLHKHWFSATVVSTYVITPAREQKVRANHKKIRAHKKSMDLWTIELTVSNADYYDGCEMEGKPGKFRTWGCLISGPPYTTCERAKDAMELIIEELGVMPEAKKSPMSVKVERLEWTPDKSEVSDEQFWARKESLQRPRRAYA